MIIRPFMRQRFKTINAEPLEVSLAIMELEILNIRSPVLYPIELRGKFGFKTPRHTD